LLNSQHISASNIVPFGDHCGIMEPDNEDFETLYEFEELMELYYGDEQDE